MKLTSYWNDTVTPFDRYAAGAVEGQFDVAVIGAGFTGLAAARALAKAGRRVVVLEKHHVGFGASGRNGGHLNNGIAHSFLDAKKHLGAERATALYKAYDDAIDLIEAIVAEEGIECSFRRCGKLKLASKAQHFEGLKRNFENLQSGVDPDVALLSRQELASEIGSDAFYGGLLMKKSAMMHMGAYAKGLAEAAVRYGATIHADAPVVARRSTSSGWELSTPKGTVAAREVILATGAYTSGPFGWFRRRFVPVGSFIIATRPLSDAVVRATLPGNRTYVTSMHVGNYFRLLPDNRLLFGGRAKFSASHPSADKQAGDILRASMVEFFPHLADIGIDYCWGGLVDMTQDRFPRAGEVDGIRYAMGYSGHGAHLSTLLGVILAEQILGLPDRNPVAGLGWSAIPGHFGTPWFLPFVGMYYRYLDRVS